MFRLVEVLDYVRIPPNRFNESIEQVASELLREKYEGKVIRDLGYIIAIFDITVSKTGKIVFGDGATYHEVRFKALTFVPIQNEVVEGEVVNLVDFGAFVRIGPIDAFIHKSQILDDTLFFNRQQGIFIGEKTGRRLEKGDIVRARIISISYVSQPGRGELMRVSLTMRQPFLGKIQWIEEDLEKIRKKKTKTEKK